MWIRFQENMKNKVDSDSNYCLSMVDLHFCHLSPESRFGLKPMAMGFGFKKKGNIPLLELDTQASARRISVCIRGKNSTPF